MGNPALQVGKDAIDYYVDNTMHRQCAYVPQHQCRHTKIKQARNVFIRIVCERDELEQDFRNTVSDSI